MVYTEAQVKKSKSYFYRTHTYREENKFKKSRVYLGTDLSPRQLKEKEEGADLILQSKGIQKKKLKEKDAFQIIKNTEWFIYHSRFTVIPILTAASLYDVFSTGARPLFGDSWDQLLMINKDDKVIVCLPTKKHQKLGQIALKQLHQDPQIMKKFKLKFASHAKRLLKALPKRLQKWNKKISPTEIIKEYNQLYKEYEEMCLWGEPFPLTVYESLTAYLENLLFSSSLSEKQKIEIYLVLITPTELSFVNREEKELYNLAKEIKKSPRLYRIFKSNPHIIINNLKDFPRELSLLQKHVKKYFWLTYDYFGEVCTLMTFIIRIKELLQYPEKLNRDFEQELSRISRKQKVSFQKLIKEEIITKHDKQIFKAVQDAALLLDFKKEIFNQVHWYINQLLKQAADYLDMSLKPLVYATKEELGLLLQNKITKEKISQRVGNSTFYFSDQGNYVFTGKNVEEIVSFIKRETKGEVKEVSGICASSGTAIGHVKILSSPREGMKLLKGEILVTGMTTPEYVPVMKKAAAIITDEGGITCHAAIVSREFGIPCIVGTKNATEVLRNGDLVEIHAGNGVVRILKRLKDGGGQKNEK